jgi:hypothetical protein
MREDSFLTFTQASTMVHASMVASRSPVWPTMSGLGKLMRTWSYLPDLSASIASCVIFADCMAGFSLKGMFWSEGTCNAEAYSSSITPALLLLLHVRLVRHGTFDQRQAKHQLTGVRHAYLMEGFQLLVKWGSAVAIPARETLISLWVTSVSCNWCIVLNVQKRGCNSTDTSRQRPTWCSSPEEGDVADLLRLRTGERRDAILGQVLASGVADLGRRHQVLLGQLQLAIVLHHPSKLDLHILGPKKSASQVLVGGVADPGSRYQVLLGSFSSPSHCVTCKLDVYTEPPLLSAQPRDENAMMRTASNQCIPPSGP